MGAGAWHKMYPEEGVTEKEPTSTPPTTPSSQQDNEHFFSLGNETSAQNAVAMSYKNDHILKTNQFATLMINDNIIIIETSSEETKSDTSSTKSELKAIRDCTGNSRAGATLRNLSDAELPDPETVRKAKQIFESLAQKRIEAASNKLAQQTSQDSSIEDMEIALERSSSSATVTPKGRAWCNGGSVVLGNSFHRHSACDSASSSNRSETPSPQPTINRKPYQRSCSELDFYFQNEDNSENENELWKHHHNQDRGSPVSPEVIAKIRQHGTCVKFYGSEAQPVSDTHAYDANYDYNDDTYHTEDRSGYLLDFALLRHHDCSRKPKIIGAIPKSNSSGSSCSSTFDDSDNYCSSGPASPFSWLNASGTLERLKAVFAGEENDSFRVGNGLSTELTEFMKVNRTKNDDNSDYDHSHHSKCHGVWRKNPCWPGSYYVIYDFTLPKDNQCNSNDYNY